MESAKDSAWSRFWEERGESHPDDDPIAIDGWDYGISLMGVEEADELREQVSLELAISSQCKFLEVGCGAGMYLLPFSEKVELAVGCDLAESMLNRARQINKSVNVLAAEANRLPYVSGEFDAILVYSVFHYFPSSDYACQVLRELYRLCSEKGKIWIGDIPDLSKRQLALEHRERLMKQNTPKWTWPDVGPLEQRFYDRAFFVEFCESVDCVFRLEDQTVEGYLQGKYRFNLFIEKR
jgi:ubiquinone/menaquinone biosynthesis C-methylase UbiE